MRTVYLIAADSVRALLHQRLLVALMLVTLGLTVVFSVLLTQAQDFVLQQIDTQGIQAPDGEMDEAQRAQVRQTLSGAGAFVLGGFYWFAALGGAFVALYVFSIAVSSEIRRGTIRVTLSKPVSRVQFLVGKYCGGIAVLLGYATIAGAALLFFAYGNDLDLVPAARYGPWLMFCSNLMVGSMAMLLSLFVRPPIAAAIAFFAGAGFLSPPNPLYYILPSYDRFNVFSHMITGRLIDAHEVLLLTLYAFDVAALLLLLALWRFQTRELL